MKLLIATVLMFIASLSYAKVPSLEKCMTQKDSLDREYCQKKRMRVIRNYFDDSYDSWKKSMSKKQKSEVTGNLKNKIAARKEMLKQLNEEMKLINAQLSMVNKIKSTEQASAEQDNQRKEKSREKRRKVKKLFKKIF